MLEGPAWGARVRLGTEMLGRGLGSAEAALKRMGGPGPGLPCGVGWAGGVGVCARAWHPRVRAPARVAAELRALCGLVLVCGSPGGTLSPQALSHRAFPCAPCGRGRTPRPEARGHTCSRAELLSLTVHVGP